MKRVHALLFWIAGCLVVAGTPLWLEWVCTAGRPKNVLADYFAGVSRIVGSAGFVEEEFRLLSKAEQVRNRWVNVVIDCRNKQEMEVLDGHLLVEGMGISPFAKHCQNSDGSWELHLMVANDLERDRVIQRVASLRADIASKNAQQVGAQNP